uniref:Large ribosomal subunit protein bL21c n=1 Tax=Ophidocladus simpliciusculus TaxID=1261574 RepID=A0A1Z1MIL3_9FLOR|nr:ribosomal protein L21 [Ophidocladus simpliciusculus]ARW65917.1 ribosomal protein L21 [Ophidocladus simpliciusculus]
MVYAVVDIGGNQMMIEPGKFYDVSYISANPGDIVNLNRVLFFAESNEFKIGVPCLKDIIIRTKVLKHIKSKKLTVFKMKPKKNIRLKQGHRQTLTRVLVEGIFS